MLLASSEGHILPQEKKKKAAQGSQEEDEKYVEQRCSSLSVLAKPRTELPVNRETHEQA